MMNADRVEEFQRIANVIPVCPPPILVSLVGSHAHGTADDTSDRDWSGVSVIPVRKLLSYTGPGRETWTHKDPDVTFHDIGKLVRLMVKGNPTIAEVLCAPEQWICEGWEDEVGYLRKACATKRLLKSYFGYYDAQVKRMKAGKSLHSSGGKYNTKWATHMYRLMVSARHLAKRGEVLVGLQGKDLEYAMEIKNGGLTQEVALEWCAAVRGVAQDAELGTKLPEGPDELFLDELVLRTRLEFGNVEEIE